MHKSEIYFDILRCNKKHVNFQMVFILDYVSCSQILCLYGAVKLFVEIDIC